MNIHEALRRGARTVQKLLESNPFFCITKEEVKTGRKDSWKMVQGKAELVSCPAVGFRGVGCLKMLNME